VGCGPNTERLGDHAVGNQRLAVQQIDQRRQLRGLAVCARWTVTYNAKLVYLLKTLLAALKCFIFLGLSPPTSLRPTNSS
jgi:hypothetical protein